MAETAELSLKRANILALKPQHLLSLRLLRMNSAELNDFVKAEIAANPFLAEKDRPLSGAPASPGPAAAETDWTQFAAAPKSLSDFLHEQIIFAFRAEKDRLAAVYLAEQLDEAGYFSADLAETARLLKIDSKNMRRILAKLQTFEPAGIFARNLAECLAIQLKNRGEYSAPMAILLKNLPLLAKGNYAALAQLCGVAAAELPAMKARILRLDPKPAAGCNQNIAAKIIPDAFVRREGAGFRVALNTDILPAVMRCGDYAMPLSAGAEEKAFFNQCRRRGDWLIHNLRQRAQFLLKLVQMVMKKQRDFLEWGARALQPLKQAEIAAALNVHESTVSRAVREKYVAVPAGILPLNYFFVAALGNKETGKYCSSRLAQERICQLIAGEPAHEVLSDSAIFSILRQEGIPIARRTIAKYRGILHIPPAFTRRRIKGNVHKLK